MQGGLGCLDVLIQRLGFGHQLQNAVFGLANLLLAELDFALKGAVLLVGLGLEHLVFQFRDLLILRLDVAVALLAFLLIGGQCRAVGLELALLRHQLLLDFSDMFGKSGDLAGQVPKAIIDFLQADHQLQVGKHS